MHYVFVVDTSASMRLRTMEGISLLDTVRISIQGLITRNRHEKHTFSLLTYRHGLEAIQMWQQRINYDFNLDIDYTDLTLTNESLSTAFRVLNLDRISQKSSLIGQGRYIYEADPAVIIHFGDNGTILNSDGSPTQVGLQSDKSSPFMSMYKHCFRWDQQLYSIVFNPRSTIAFSPTTQQPCSNGKSVGENQIDQLSHLCEQTGGNSSTVNSRQSLEKRLQELLRLSNRFVTIVFTAFTDGEHRQDKSLPPTTLQTVHVSPMSMSHTWPLPEPFWLPSVQNIPVQDPHLVVHVTHSPNKASIVMEFPFDKYPLETSPLTHWVLSHRRSDICFYCYVCNSHARQGRGLPFGYLKPSSDMRSVNLVVLPYDFEVLNGLSHSFFKVHGKNPNASWRAEFAKYINNIPSYYYGPLKAVVRLRFGNNIFQDIPDERHPASFSKLRTLRAQARIYQENVMKAIQLPRRQQRGHVAMNTVAAAEDTALPASAKSAKNTTHDYLYGASIPKREIVQELSGIKEMRADSTAHLGFNIPQKSDLLFKIRDLRMQLHHAASGVLCVDGLDQRRFEQTESALNKSRVEVTLQEEGSDIPLFGNPYRLARGKMDEADDLSLDRRRPSLRNGKRSSSRTSNDRSSPIPFSMSIQPIQSSHAHGDHDISENDASLTSLLREEGDISCSVSFSKPTPKRSKFGTDTRRE
eukprot:gene9428-1670_t